MPAPGDRRTHSSPNRIASSPLLLRSRRRGAHLCSPTFDAPACPRPAGGLAGCTRGNLTIQFGGHPRRAAPECDLRLHLESVPRAQVTTRAFSAEIADNRRSRSLLLMGKSPFLVGSISLFSNTDTPIPTYSDTSHGVNEIFNTYITLLSLCGSAAQKVPPQAALPGGSCLLPVLSA